MKMTRTKKAATAILVAFAMLAVTQDLRAETTTETTETIKDGVKTAKTFIVRDDTAFDKKTQKTINKKTEIDKQTCTRNGKVIRTLEASARFVEGVFLERGTTINLFTESGLLKQRDYLHNESYKSAMRYRRQVFEYTTDGKLKAASTLSFRTGLLQSLEMTSEYDESGRVTLRSEPILKASVLVGKMITKYSYAKTGKRESTVVCKYDNAGKLTEETRYSYDRTGSLK